MMKNRKMVKGIALGAMIAALAAGGTAAYLTDFETATNSGKRKRIQRLFLLR